LIATAIFVAVISAQAPARLRVEVVVPGASGAAAPVPRHALLVSDNPATAPPRRIVTAADGTVAIALPPGSYIVESDQPIVIAGRAYQWTEIVELRAGRDAVLRLTESNAEVTTPASSPAGGGAVSPAAEAASLLAQWQGGIAAVWSPTLRASAFLIDPSGLLVTTRAAVGGGEDVTVQIDAALRVQARLIAPQSRSAAAVLLVHPSVVATRAVLPVTCPPPPATSLDEGREVVALGWPLRGTPDVTWGEVTGVSTRAVETDVRLWPGGAGGPVFDEGGTLVGMTMLPGPDSTRRPGDADILRVGIVCEAIAEARAAMSGLAPPEATALPVTPVRPFPFPTGTTEVAADAPASAVLTSLDFEVTLLTPPMIHAARQRADRTGGQTRRDPEAEMRLGRITDFGAWSDYFADLPAVVAVRVTPKLVEGFWKRLARGAALTQGAVLPAFKDFKTSFARMTARCGTTDVAPLHPFVLEHRLAGRDVVREGLYVFAPDALGPHCGEVTLTLYSPASPTRGEAVTVPADVVERVWRDFAPWREADQASRVRPGAK
jgi:S1-C subfamily serine protease